MELRDLIADASVLLSLEPEELAPVVLRLAKSRMQNGLVHVDYLAPSAGAWGYGNQFDGEVTVAVREAWSWLQFNLFIVPATGLNGSNGFFVMARRAQKISNDDQFANFRRAASFPRALLHPSIADAVWIALARGDFQVAVFQAFRAVEEAVRAAGGYAATDIGVPLMRKAFDAKSGPLARKTDPEAEREALCHLFAGAIGSYKNPHSHRTVTIQDAGEAQEMVMLASHLLRIVDARRPTT